VEGGETKAELQGQPRTEMLGDQEQPRELPGHFSTVRELE
jgi:hypothetical protein